MTATILPDHETAFVTSAVAIAIERCRAGFSRMDGLPDEPEERLRKIENLIRRVNAGEIVLMTREEA